MRGREKRCVFREGGILGESGRIVVLVDEFIFFIYRSVRFCGVYLEDYFVFILEDLKEIGEKRRCF